MHWLIYLLLFCFVYALGYDKGRNHAHIETQINQCDK